MQQILVIQVLHVCDLHTFIGEDVIASSYENTGGSVEGMNVFQAGADIAVTQLKSNIRDEGQLVCFFSLLCSLQESRHSFKASSFLTLTQLEEAGGAAFPQEIHHPVLSL